MSIGNSPDGKYQKSPETAEEILADIQDILLIEDVELQEETMNTYIGKRLKELGEEVPEKQKMLSLINSRAEGQFIHPETEIKRSLIVDGLKINDPDIYKYLLESFAKFYKSWNKPQLKSTTGHSVIYALGDYFGNYFGTGHTETRNVEFYMDHSTMDSEAVNLSEIKGKKLAVCAEKATVTHNYLKFLGIDSHVIFSNNCKLGESNNGHAYVVYSNKKGRFIFDPSNPVLVEDVNGKITGVNPAIYKISEEDYNHLLNRNGQQVTVQHIDQKLDNGKYIPQAPQSRIYG